MGYLSPIYGIASKASQRGTFATPTQVGGTSRLLMPSKFSYVLQRAWTDEFGIGVVVSLWSGWITRLGTYLRI